MLRVLRKALATALVRGEERNDLQKAGRRKLLEQPVLAELAGSRVPVVAQSEVAVGGGERSGEQFEDRQSHAAGVDLLEHLADRFLRCRFGETYRRNLVVVEGQNDFFLKALPFFQAFRRWADVRHLPIERRVVVEYDLQREHLRGDLLLSVGQCQIDLAPEVAANHTVRRHAHDRFFLAIGVIGYRLVDVDVVVPVQLPAARIAGLHRLGRLQRKEQRRQALLTVEEQGFRVRLGLLLHSFQQPGLKENVRVSGLQGHHRADRVGQRNRSQQTFDMVVIPHPTALKVRQLQRSLANVGQDLWQWQIVARESLFHLIGPPVLWAGRACIP